MGARLSLILACARPPPPPTTHTITVKEKWQRHGTGETPQSCSNHLAHLK